MIPKQLDNLAKALRRYEITESYILKYCGLEVLNKVKEILNETLQTPKEMEYPLLPLDD